jgi:beta-aspartyl-peptidase (threonine type)
MWLVAASGNGLPGIGDAAGILRNGGHAIDAVEAGILPVESNTSDHSVGLGGLPNILGQVELDASIMDGRTLAAGSVGALQGYEHPISVARQVMELSPHVMLVGEGARRFAVETGFPVANLLTTESRLQWREELERFVPPQEVQRIAERQALLPLVNHIQDRMRHLGTVTFLALDNQGNFASGVSTSGWAWKYPGRLGDSPIIGAGAYADNRYGASACIGYGELVIRLCTSRSVVLYMKMGMSVEQACREAMGELKPLLIAHGASVAILAADPQGQVCGFSTASQPWPYLLMTSESEAVRSIQPVPFPLTE